jgi:hypothetical protein
MKLNVPTHNSSIGWFSVLRRPIKITLIVLLSFVATYSVTIHYLVPSPYQRLINWADEHGRNLYGDPVRLRNGIIRIPGRIFRTVEIPKLVVDINFKNTRVLQEKRAEAISTGVLIRSPGDVVSASIRHEDKTTKVKLRLKGDWTDHLKGDKWSFRVHVKGKDHLFGMRRFSIQHPKVRGYQGENLFFETLRYVNVLAPRYMYVDVVVNGNKMGIMALEEHFSKELLESNGRKDGVIVRFDESLLWKARAQKGEDFNDAVFHNYKNASIDAFRSSRVAKSERLSREYDNAVSLLRSFVSGAMPASDVFDVQQLGRYLAVVELWGARHSIYWHNHRFYLNPITSRLEPIGFDANLDNRKPAGELANRVEPLVAAMLDDQRIFTVYSQTLKKLAKDILNGKLLRKLSKVEQQYLPILQKEFYFLEPFKHDELITRANYILALNEDDLKVSTITAQNYPTLVHAYTVQDRNGRLYLELANAVPHEVDIQSIRWVAKNGKSILFQPVTTVKMPFRLASTTYQSLPKSSRIYYRPLPASPNRYSLEIGATIRGQKRRYTTIAQPYYEPAKKRPIPVSTADKQLLMHSFLKLDKKNKGLYVKTGNWRVTGSVIVPEDYSLTIQEGTTLQFTAEEGIISYGPITIKGSKIAPVVLTGQSFIKNVGTWQGVAVLNAGRLSKWSNVIVRNTTGVRRSVWELTGGVNFYKSDVHIEKSRFEGNMSEDVLNIVHSKFKISNIEIMDAASDGFDADFAEGSVEGGVFQNIGKKGGGDAIDISGSIVTVDGTVFKEIDDKALSVGENSKMVASHVLIEQAGVGAVAKDGSKLQISDSTIKFARNAGLMAYIKKPEYGAGHIEAKNIIFIGTTKHTRAQKESSIIIDGKLMESEDVDVKQLYRTIMRPGLRK